MPAARAHDQHRRLVRDLIALLAFGIGETEFAGPAVLQVDLAFDVVRPGRRVGVLEIRHEDVGAAIERIDDHLAVDRPGDLDAPVRQVLRDRRDAPVLVVADHLGAGPEIRQFARIVALLLLGARREDALAPCLELAMQIGEEAQCRRGEHLGVAGGERRLDPDAVNARCDRSGLRVARSRRHAATRRPPARHGFGAAPGDAEQRTPALRRALCCTRRLGGSALARGFLAARLHRLFGFGFPGRGFFGRRLLGRFLRGLCSLLFLLTSCCHPDCHLPPAG